MYPNSGMPGAPPFTRTENLRASWHYALIDFIHDARCAALYEHISVALPDGTWLEMRKRRSFALASPYLTAPPEISAGDSVPPQ